MLLKPDYIRRITQRLTEFSVFIASLPPKGYTDENHAAEDFYCGLFNILFKATFIVMDREEANFPGIDLGDEGLQTGIQITSDASTTKIHKSLSKVTDERHGVYERFPNFRIFILTEKQSFPKVVFDTQRKVNFDKDKDVLDKSDIIKMIDGEDIDIVREIHDYIEKRLEGTIHRTNNSDNTNNGIRPDLVEKMLAGKDDHIATLKEQLASAKEENERLRLSQELYDAQELRKQDQKIIEKIIEDGKRTGKSMLFQKALDFCAKGMVEKAIASLSATAISDYDELEASKLWTLKARLYRVKRLFKDLEDSYEKALAKHESGALLLEYGNYQTSHGHFTDAEKYLQRAIDTSEKEFDMITLASALNSLGVHHYMQNSFGEAKKLYQRAISISQDLNDRLGEASAMNNLAEVCSSLQDLDSFFRYSMSALEIFKSLDKHEEEAMSLANIGVRYFKGEDFRNSRRFLSNALDIATSLSEETENKNSLLGMIHLNLANFYSHLKRDHETAIHHINLAIDIKRELAGARPDAYSDELAAALVMRATILNQEKQSIDSMRLYQEPLRILDDLRKYNPAKYEVTYSKVIANYGIAQARSGAYSKAEPLLLEARGIQESALAKDFVPNYHTLKGTYANLSLLYKNMKLKSKLIEIENALNSLGEQWEIHGSSRNESDQSQ
jgi:tetratricopeptide (TPR) repeat protein